MIDYTADLSDYTAPGAGVPACVVQIYGEPLGRRVQLLSSPISFGRDASCDVAITDETVSRQHAKLVQFGREWWLEDLGSRNGTVLNALEIERPTRLSSGDQIKIGRVVFKFLASGNVEALFHEAILEMATMDGLTGVANRRHLEAFLQRELSYCLRHHKPLAVVMFDLDRFKLINDELGHLGGDEVLRAVAWRIKTEIPPNAMIGRYGGEEFVVVLPKCSADQAAAAAENYRKSIEQNPVSFEHRPVSVSASFGVVSARPGDSVKSLMQRVDGCQYKAKQAGRNRIVSDADAG